MARSKLAYGQEKKFNAYGYQRGLAKGDKRYKRDQWLGVINASYSYRAWEIARDQYPDYVVTAIYIDKFHIPL